MTTSTPTPVFLPSPLKACIFDFDMTLADGGPWIVACYQTVLQRHGYCQVSESAIRNTIGLTIEDSFALMTGTDDRALCWQMRQEFKTICRPRIAEKTVFYPDAVRFLQRLKGAGIACAIVSTKETAAIRQTLELYRLDALLDCVVGLTEVKEAKPSPEGILYVLRELGLSPEEALYFGDNPVDGEAAQRASVAYIGVAKGIHNPEQLAAFPHLAIIRNYDEIAELNAAAEGCTAEKTGV